MAGISDKALKSQYAENKYRYNAGSELQNKEFSDGSGLEMYETPFRMYDPQLGVFHQIDQLADIMEGWSPYTFALDNPISYNDAWGLAPSDSTGKGADVKPMEEVVVTAKKKDCTTCDPVTVNAPPPPSSVAAPINSNSGSNTASVITVTALGEGAEGGVTIVGGASVLPALIVAGAIYGYENFPSNPPSPLVLPNSDNPSFARPVAIPGVLNVPHVHSPTYPGQPWGEQYTLRALADGLYPVFQWGKGQVSMKHLSRGDIWKIGTTINGTSRYSNSYYTNTGAGLYYAPEFTGPVEQLLFVERMKLLNYAIQNGGSLPPGNTKLQ